jgi:outer membrane protein insertion porin family
MGLLPNGNAAPGAPPSPSAAVPAVSPKTLEGRKVTALEVEGNRRIEKDAVLNKIRTKPGEKLDEDVLRLDVQALFAMGFFEDIDVQAETVEGGVKLVYVVRERPVISSVEFEGNEQLSDSDLREVAKVKVWSILDLNKVREDVGLLQRHYEEKGFYLAKVEFDLRPVAGKSDEIALVYRINDYEKVKIKQITFLNNRRFTDEQLKAVLGETKEGGVLSFLTGSGSFKESSFKQDLQRLTYWYLENGYVKFRYEAPVVTVSEDKKYLFVSIYVDEGEQYSMGEIDFGGDLLFTKDELRESVELTQGKRFSISQRNQDIQRLTERYQDLGYAFVNVVPRMNVDDEKRLVSISYDFEKGSLVYFGEINVTGNSKTHDKVIRRELRIREGELYSGTKLRVSRENVERLGYFAPGEVIFNTITPKEKPDVLNVEITVKERSTGTVTLGAGYGSAQGFFFTAQISEINLMGRGQSLTLAGQYSTNAFQQSFNLGFTDPYAFDTRWSAGFDLYYVNFPIPQKYSTRKLGTQLRVGHPIGDYTMFFTSYKFERMRVESLSAEQLNTQVEPEEVEADNGYLSSVVFSLVRDKRNNRFETTGGDYQSASFEIAGLGGDKHFLKYQLNNRFYTRVVGDLVFRTNQEFGHIVDLDANRRVPPSERFYLGGPNNMRGFRFFELGPSRIRNEPFTNNNDTPDDPSDDFPDTRAVREPQGGNVQLFSIFELEHPIIREAGLKGVLFYDVGNVFQTFDELTRFELRQDVGFGLRWFSPIGPLRFEFGYPLKRRAGEQSPEFNFFIGTPF